MTAKEVIRMTDNYLARWGIEGRCKISKNIESQKCKPTMLVLARGIHLYCLTVWELKFTKYYILRYKTKNKSICTQNPRVGCNRRSPNDQNFFL